MLKSENIFPPGGFQFYQPETKWPRDPAHDFLNMDMDALVSAIVSHRAANPQHHLSLDRQVIRAEVHSYNHRRLVKEYGAGKASQWVMGPMEGTALPKLSAPAGAASSATEAMSAGMAALKEWLGAGMIPVPQEEADRRAAICAACPENQPANVTEWMFSAVAGTLKLLLQARRDLRMETRQDGALNACKACRCVLKLKVWMPLEHIKARMKPETGARLDPKCWVLN